MAEKPVTQDSTESQANPSRPQFRKDHVELIHAQMRVELLVSVIVLGVVAVLVWGTLSPAILSGWSLLAFASVGWRSLLIESWYRRTDALNMNLFGGSYLGGAFLSGCIWGSLGYLVFEYGNRAHLPYVMAALVCMAMVSFTSMQSSPRAYLCYAVPLLMPTAALLVLSGDLHVQLVAVIPALLLLSLFSSTRGFADILEKAFRLSSHNADLIKKLVIAQDASETAKQGLEKANRELMEQIDERRLAEERIRQAKERMQAIFDGMEDTILQVDSGDRVIWITPSAKALLGYSPQEIVGKPASCLFRSEQDYQKHSQDLDGGFGRLQHHEMELIRKNGSVVWVSENASYKYSEVGNIIGYEATLRDITALKQTKEALYLAQEQAYVTLGSIGDGVIVIDLEGRVEYMNAVAEAGTGWKVEEAHGKPLSEVFRIVDEKTLKPVPDPCQLCLQEMKTTMLPGYNLLLHKHHNQRMSIEVNTSPIHDSSRRLSGVVLVFHDVSELRSLAQMTYHATHDALTDLINRREFERRVGQSLEHARDKNTRYALCYLDLDNFKVVNDTCGHVAGDELLKQLSHLLHSRLREVDTISRIGGDEFGILFGGCPIRTAERLAEKLRSAIDEFRFIWDDKSFRVGASIGLVPITAESGSLSDVLSAADSACYVAKESGRNRIHVYELHDSDLVERQGQMLWVQRIQEVLEKDRFELYFQVITPISGNEAERGRLHGEVLVRMRDDDGVMVGPGAFIPAAERYSLMPAIDRWIVENTLKILARDIDYVKEHISACSINLSGQSLSDDRFMRALVDMIVDTGVPPEVLCFEITETAVISNLTTATSLINMLRDMGCSFALDDFGVGLSSFGYLKNLPVDYLKLDGCFIRNMTRDPIDHAMVQSINHIGQTMKIRTIAEFVEDEATLRALEEIGVDYAQGYHVGKPMRLADAIFAGRPGKGISLAAG